MAISFSLLDCTWSDLWNSSEFIGTLDLQGRFHEDEGEPASWNIIFGLGVNPIVVVFHVDDPVSLSGLGYAFTIGCLDINTG
ncbi:hypothetical protein OIU74_027720 [Salix koriyanagi]|uniref:Uncharacterized protein n=1 Tax=Salix koriyanagi TaxID=2511006 RepID=A0A9Q0VQU2_9ROSI|nr:hypothetical protein OIU74_027720 [Salix koriyanagi]